MLDKAHPTITPPRKLGSNKPAVGPGVKGTVVVSVVDAGDWSFVLLDGTDPASMKTSG